MQHMKVVILSLLSLLSSFSINVNNEVSFSYEKKSLNFDCTDVLDDLYSSKNFDILDYPFDETSNLQIINFIEYEYSFYSNLLDNYSLYVYIYNPTNININEKSELNKIELATHWNDEHLPDEYNKFQLEFLSVSNKDPYQNLFYKFKVIMTESQKEELLNNLNSNERRYDISSIELTNEATNETIDYMVGGTYIYSGYSKGFGNSQEDTLTCKQTDLETISIEVNPTYYRLNSSTEGQCNQSELDSVYFSIPNYLLEKYGNLQKIKAEWYEYKTSPIVILENQRAYNLFYEHIGENKIPNLEPDKEYVSDYDLFTGTPGNDNENESGVGFWSEKLPSISDLGVIKYAFNYHKTYSFYSKNFDEITWLFWTNGKNYEDFELSSNELLEYAENYQFFNNGKILDKYSKDLFKGKVEENRTEGYNLKEFDSSVDNFNLLDYSSNASGWDKFFDYFGNWWNIPDSEQVENINPILKIDPTNNETYFTSDNLLVRNDDLDDLYNFYLNSEENNETAFLFRFATTNYSAYPIYVSTTDEATYTKEGYIAQTTAFLNFDIISLTFSKDGEYHTIAAVHDPIDIINDVTAPIEDNSNWGEKIIQIIMGVAVLILSVFLLYKLFKLLFEYIRS